MTDDGLLIVDDMTGFSLKNLVIRKDESNLNEQVIIFAGKKWFSNE